MEKIGNIYGAAQTAADIIARFEGEKAFEEARASGNNLAVRIFLSSYGFNRVSRSFADAVLKG
jgi:hypothetical protein